MEWNGSFRVPFGSNQEGDDDEEDDHEFHTTKSILDHNFNPFPGRECVMKGLKLVQRDEEQRPVTISVPQNINTTSNIARGTAITSSSSSISNNNSSSSSNWSNLQAERMKRKMTNEQLDSLERSFQEEIKLEPERKVRLAQELGLQPRQVAVWFQNRRARWKTKQLERHFNSLKQEFLLISRENQKLQEEVVKLKGKIEDLQALGNQGSICDIADYTDASKEESVESKSAAICGFNNLLQGPNSFNCHQNIGDCNSLFNVEEYGTLASPSPPYWGSLPGY